MPQTKERHAEWMRERRVKKKQEHDLATAVKEHRVMTASLTEQEACIFSAVNFRGLSKNAAIAECAECDNKESKEYEISHYGISQVGEEKEEFQPTPYEALTAELKHFSRVEKSLGDAATVRDVADYIMYAPSPTALTMRVRDVFTAGQSHAYMGVLTQWILERQRINRAVAEREKQTTFDKQLTVSGASKMCTPESFDHSNRLTVGSKYKMPKRGEENEQ